MLIRYLIRLHGVVYIRPPPTGAGYCPAPPVRAILASEAPGARQIKGEGGEAVAGYRLSRQSIDIIFKREALRLVAALPAHLGSWD